MCEAATDLRWNEVIDFLLWFDAGDGSPPGPEFGERLERFLANLDALAADRTLPDEERAIAQRCLDAFTTLVRANAADILRAVARKADDADASPAERAEAKRMLAEAAERLPAASSRVQ